MSVPLLIADSGPLIALARLDLLRLPGHYFSATLVTATVWEEVLRKPRGEEEPRLRQAVELGWLNPVADPVADALALPAALREPGIDLGELSVIVLACEMGAVVLIDDLRARRAAGKLALPMVGTVGLLARARMSGLIGPLRPLVDRLSETGYYLPEEAVRQVLAELGEA